MGTVNTNFLPNQTGLNLGSPDQRWNGFFGDILVTGSINGGFSSSDSVQIVSTSQSLGFANSIHTLILATGGVAGISLSLPSAALYSGRIMRIKKTDLSAGAVNLVGSIDGMGSYSLTNQYQFVCLESGNGAWNIVGAN